MNEENNKPKYGKPIHLISEINKIHAKIDVVVEWDRRCPSWDIERKMNPYKNIECKPKYKSNNDECIT